MTRLGQKFQRCPKAWLRDEAIEAREFLDDHYWLVTYGVMPRPGGKLDQSPRFLEAVSVIDRERELLKGVK